MPKIFNILPENLIKKKNPLHCDVCDLIPDQAPDGEDNFLGGWGQTITYAIPNASPSASQNKKWARAQPDRVLSDGGKADAKRS